uniref:potassium/sodium hyperpolarization-activated cyclic nucleotide-gated channel 4-like n=1 Tax=Podarcis muralis TaxID=64176 RepID=UPI00109F71C1|nr:potassium/sodium hyperpolarization-activated cyclic nucleotide-gated channel 4-like [Podarcis muralis]XP_028585578.1 potassium/sodium hyperpolarization-activated cyclic nucleotide-gated channel 4-like [Podarcis muralis]
MTPRSSPASKLQPYPQSAPSASLRIAASGGICWLPASGASSSHDAPRPSFAPPPPPPRSRPQAAGSLSRRGLPSLGSCASRSQSKGDLSRPPPESAEAAVGGAGAEETKRKKERGPARRGGSLRRGHPRSLVSFSPPTHFPSVGEGGAADGSCEAAQAEISPRQGFFATKPRRAAAPPTARGQRARPPCCFSGRHVIIQYRKTPRWEHVWFFPSFILTTTL